MKRRLGVLGLIVMLAACGASYGAIVVIDGTDGGEWDDGGAGPPWYEAQSPAGASGSGLVSSFGYDQSVPAADAVHTGAMQINVADPLAATYVDKIFADGDLSGASGGGVDWGSLGNGVRGISFDFYVDAGDPVPSAMNIYFRGGGAYWYYNVPVSSFSSGSWADSSTLTADGYLVGVAANVAYGGGWVNLFGPSSGANWVAAYGAVDEVGLEIQWASNPGGPTVYGLDNFALHDEPVIGLVPEPGTYMALATALLSMGITFRRRLNDSLAALLKS